MICFKILTHVGLVLERLRESITDPDTASYDAPRTTEQRGARRLSVVAKNQLEENGFSDQT